ncbi:hypothetical protein K490DRAFT_67380 [Saccharata proteae CBS 121410]|uniref:Mitochondrial outer membrane translocase complex, subunit Tom5 n=1 Tax=Saccharata proteae CBS 121410 TaxID=1314787 RepID=A0A9P4LYA3_9PEZI|nr:hypothetical protein K490DRAFT_67380 [Saccharata proteae CBS 121410]
MFGGPPPPPSKAELAAMEAEASANVRMTAAACVFLYLSPFAVEYVQRLF